MIGGRKEVEKILCKINFSYIVTETSVRIYEPTLFFKLYEYLKWKFHETEEIFLLFRRNCNILKSNIVTMKETETTLKFPVVWRNTNLFVL